MADLCLVETDEESKMKKIFILMLLFPLILLGQQLNHTWGYTTAGVAYTQVGSADADSGDVISIVFDLQDWYPLDWNPLVLDVQASSDSSEAAHGLSSYTFIGTFWLRLDAENATDSTGHAIFAYPGNMIYYPGTGGRITATNLNFSTTATTLLDTTAGVNDVQWQFVNVYVNSSADVNSATVKYLPPEFLRIDIEFQTNVDDSLDVYWDFVYPASKQFDQEMRSTTNSGNAKKRKDTLH